MANTKSAKKRAKTNEIRRKRNAARKSEIKTATKKVLAAAESGNIVETILLLRAAESKIGKARKKGTLKKNTAARKISRLVKRVKKIVGVEKFNEYFGKPTEELKQTVV